MTELTASKPSLRARAAAVRRSSDGAGNESIRIQPALVGHAIPWLIEPAREPLDLTEWASSHRDTITSLLREHRALLFRGFRAWADEELGRFLEAISDGPRLEYRDRSTPRQEIQDRLYTSTQYPAEHAIAQHNEGTYWRVWPLTIAFGCVIAPEDRGATPIADCRRVLARLDPDLVGRFHEKGVRYVRNYNDGFGLRWQDVFQTTDPAEVEAYCRDNAIEVEWKAKQRLRTRQVRAALAVHPRTGEKVWFNHAAFFHVSSLEPEIRTSLVAELGEAELPYNTYYGDGTPIEPEALDQIRQAYRDETVRFAWQRGDVLLLDNMTIAHGREPYTGERRIIVGMSEPYGG
jgi:alpha-ketoglutarate-dependent taurine dioxygenase